MKQRQRVLVVFGTRPEAIKMAPVVHALQARPDDFDTGVCVTAQHRDMLDQVLDFFDIKPDFDLDLMKANQTLYDVTAGVLSGMGEVIRTFKPDVVLVHGDTTTSFAASLAAFYEKVAVGHVEAGLRTGNIYSPWPEEMNRKLTGAVAQLHFAPTTTNEANLKAENVDPASIHVTGNTVIDALLAAIDKIENSPELQSEMAAAFGNISPDNRLILVTAHRRENFGDGIENICLALKDLVERHQDIELVYPVHPNPNVKDVAYRILADTPRIHLHKPLDYAKFCYLQKRATLVLTDSGGLQEEAPGLGKPVLVMRDTTERPEAVAAGTVKLVATDRANIVATASKLLDDPVAYEQMASSSNPYGDGTAAQKIADILNKVKVTC